jgi:hypothetical protein
LKILDKFFPLNYKIPKEKGRVFFSFYHLIYSTPNCILDSIFKSKHSLAFKRATKRKNIKANILYKISYFLTQSKVDIKVTVVIGLGSK